MTAAKVPRKGWNRGWIMHLVSTPLTQLGNNIIAWLRSPVKLCCAMGQSEEDFVSDRKDYSHNKRITTFCSQTLLTENCSLPLPPWPQPQLGSFSQNNKKQKTVFCCSCTCEAGAAGALCPREHNSKGIGFSLLCRLFSWRIVSTQCGIISLPLERSLIFSHSTTLCPHKPLFPTQPKAGILSNAFKPCFKLRATLPVEQWVTGTVHPGSTRLSASLHGFSPTQHPFLFISFQNYVLRARPRPGDLETIQHGLPPSWMLQWTRDNVEINTDSVTDVCLFLWTFLL